MKVWVLVFLFNAQAGPVPMVSGPHELEVCLMMAADVRWPKLAHCWNPATQERRYAASMPPKEK